MRATAYAGLAVAAVALAGGCGGRETSGTADAEQLQLDATVYWLGRSFEDLPLTHSEGPPTGMPRTTTRASGPLRPPTPLQRAFFVYGECNGTGSGDSFHCTGPQVQVQNWPIASPGRYPNTLSCTRTEIRGVPAAQFDGFEVYAGDSLVRIYAPTRAQARRAAAALRRLEGAVSERLPQPVIDVRGALKRCALDSLDDKLAELRANATTPLFWVGRRFERAPLFRAEGDGLFARFSYGTCKTPEVAGSCYPPLEIEVEPTSRNRPSLWRAVVDGVLRCEQVGVGGAQAAFLPAAGELVVFTGASAVTLRGPDPERLRRAAEVLSPFAPRAAEDELPPPAEQIAAELARVCDS